MSQKPILLQRSDWAADDELWKGRFEGKDVGADGGDQAGLGRCAIFYSEKVDPVRTLPVSLQTI